MRAVAAIFLILGVQIPITWPYTLLADDAAAAAICGPIFGAEASEIMTAFKSQGLDSLEGCRAYAFLLERNGTGTVGTSGGCYRTQNDRIIKLNPGFAVSLYRALTEIEKQYGGKNIIQSGYRCDGSRTHPAGCAADIIWTSCRTNPKPSLTGRGTGPWECSSDRWDAPEQQWIEAHGKEERYKIHFPYKYFPEGHHVEPINTQGCRTTAPVMGPGGGYTPTGGVADYFRQAFGMQQQPQLPPQPTLPPQPYAQQQPLLNAFQQPLQPLQPIAPQPIGTTSTSSNSNTNTNTNTNTNQNSNNSSTSVVDRLLELAFGTSSAPSSGTFATSAPIIITGASAGTIASSQGPGGTQPSSQATTGGLPVGQQTFVPNGPGTQASNATQSYNSRLLQTLETLKSALQLLLKYLTPFRVQHHETEYDY